MRRMPKIGEIGVGDYVIFTAGMYKGVRGRIVKPPYSWCGDNSSCVFVNPDEDALPVRGLGGGGDLIQSSLMKLRKTNILERLAAL
jgi:hypothetical protein